MKGGNEIRVSRGKLHGVDNRVYCSGQVSYFGFVADVEKLFIRIKLEESPEKSETPRRARTGADGAE